MLSGNKAEINLSGGHMTEYDVHEVYKKQVEKNRITSLHANNGVLEVRYADGTMEIFTKSKWRNKLKKIRRRQ